MPVEIKDIVWLGFVTVASSHQQETFANVVKNMRTKLGVNPTSNDGPDEFVRALKAQEGCGQSYGPFLARLWTAGLFVNQVPAAMLGILYMYGRHRYFEGFISSPEESLPGYKVCLAALRGLLFLSIVGVGQTLLLKFLGFNTYGVIAKVCK